MRPLKIAVIGAGSRSFGLSTTAALLREQEIRGSTLALVDLDSDSLEVMHTVASRMNAEWDAGASITATTDRTEALRDADFCILSVEKGDRATLWRLDFRIPLRHGVRQPLSENGGPGGFAHLARQVPPILDIARDMERLCPNAWLLNFSNPVPRVTRAVRKYTRIKAAGLCHQIYYLYRLAGKLMPDVLDLPVPKETRAAGLDGWEQRVVASAAYHRDLVNRLDVKAAGLNHFTWAFEMRDRRDGTDLLPEFKRRLDASDEDPLTRDMMRLTGMVPVPGDTHLAEYLPFCSNPVSKPWERYHLNPPPFAFEDLDSPPSYREWLKPLTADLAAGRRSVEPGRYTTSEGVWEVIHGIATNDNGYHPAVNIPNHGALPDLPFESVVEVPAVSCATGLKGLTMGWFPTVVAELLRRETTVVELAVDAAVKGDRQLALQALMLDPVVDDYELAQAILKDYLEEEAPQLPQFYGQWTLEQ